MPEIKNTFLKGKMNQDLDSRLLPNGEYREAINLMISRSEGSTVGEFENVLGNTSIKELSVDNEAVIGHFVNQTTNKVYLFATQYNNADGVRSSGQEHRIFELDLNAPYNLKTLVTGNFLNFNQSFPITGVNLVEDLLFWTDNLNQPRKINISLANPTNAATPTHYTNEDQISVAKYAPCKAILAMQRINARANGAVSNSTTVVLDSSTGIQPGDIISPWKTIVLPTASEFSPLDKSTYVVAVNPASASNTVTVSRALTIADGQHLVFSRPTSTQKTKELKSNGYEGTVETTPGGGVYTVVYPATELKGTYNGSYEDLRYTNMIPRIGDLVTSSVSNAIPAGTTVLTAVCEYAGIGVNRFTFTFSETVTLSVGNNIKISVNPDYDSNWTGDAKFLEDKFVRFSYRFKFEDNEYSLMAPFSQCMFIPKQYSEFGGGSFPQPEDMDNAFESTILNWFENNTQNINLRIPFPESTVNDAVNNLLITSIDVLYKESDSLAVKVLDTVDLVNISSLSSMRWWDPVNGENQVEKFYEYDYASNKPYKTLPNSQTVRVYDKVPLKALSQEIISNRIVYGNYIDKHTSPSSINFSALTDNKKPYNTSHIEYPYHNLKQDRTYQVGFILADRYGRQSDVILSAYDDVPGAQGSTVFLPYNTLSDQISNPILDWLGKTLSIRVDNAIGTETTGGQPGIWHATNNPLGWYSYKIVVKQQEQEYYNVYLPGFVNGLPITGTSEENKSAFSVLLSDNINKIPRDLNEVGPTDTEYTSSQVLNIRVNNPRINNRQSARPYGYPRTSIAWNTQYYPGNIAQEVLSIQTIRDMEIQSIPFKAGIGQGPYGQVVLTDSSGVTTPSTLGSIPWGTTPASAEGTPGANPDVGPLYNADLNPFAIKIDITQNGKIQTLQSTIAGPVGAKCTSQVSLATNNLPTMSPFLAIAETRPVFSLLELFYETSLQGKINTLNSLINAQDPGITALTTNAANFPESLAATGQIGTDIEFVTGGGTTVTNNNYLSNISIVSAYRANDLSQSNNVSSLFTLTHSGASAEYQLKTASGTTFWYSALSDANPSNDVYNLTFAVTYQPGGVGQTYTSNVTYTATLTNVAPTFDSCTNPTGITIASTTIKQFTAKNGSANVANRTNELLFDLDPTNASSVLNKFTMSSSGLLTANTGSLVEGDTWTIKARVRDVNGNGLSATCQIQFTVGIQHVPRAICYGRQGSASAACNQSYETFFGASNSTTSTGAYGTIGGIFYPSNAIQFYNVRANAAAGSTTGALTQGVMKITPLLTQTGGTGSISCYVTIQYRANANSSWSQAVDTGNNTINNIQLTASNGFPGTVTKNFSIPGEYRAFTTNVTGEACGTGTQSLVINFGDATYTGQCNLGPL